MNAGSFALILTGALLNAGAQLLLKAGASQVGPIDMTSFGIVTIRALAVSWPVSAGIACYAISVVLWLVALSRVDVSLAYPMVSIGYVVNAVAAWILFGEALTPLRVAGIGVIIVGVSLLAASGRVT